MDLAILIILLAVVIFFFRRFSCFIYFIAKKIKTLFFPLFMGFF